MKLSVIIPARDEQQTIAEVLDRIELVLQDLKTARNNRPAITSEVIVVDDGSSDATATIAGARPTVTVLSLDPGQGKGSAVRKGIERADGDLILIQDADLEYDPADYPLLLEPVLAGRADVVYGSRILGAQTGRSTGISSLRFYLGGRFLSWLTNLLFGSRITDEPTCYKLVRTRLLHELDLQATGFELCPELTGKLLRKGHQIHEVPISYAPRSIAEGKKIRWKDGVIAILTLLRIRLFWPP